MRRDELSIAVPCHVDWDTMTARGRSRFCGACKKHVHDLSRMTESEARTLLGGRSDLCVRYAIDDLGGVRFAAERLVSPSSLVRGKRMAVAALAVATLAACTESVATPVYPQQTMGYPVYVPQQAVDADAGVLPVVPPETPTR